MATKLSAAAFPWRELAIPVISGVVVWWLTSTMAQKADKAIAEATQPAGELLSDFTAGLNGYRSVELTPLQIRRHYLTPDWRLNQEAETVLWNVKQYRPALTKLFGSRGGVMRPEYRPLIDVPIE